jgi:hypothetical protein
MPLIACPRSIYEEVEEIPGDTSSSPVEHVTGVGVLGADQLIFHFYISSILSASSLLGGW